jgi:hypothetical protein
MSAGGQNNQGQGNGGSLLSPKAIGGIVGSGGYDFQTRYIACHYAEWILDKNFVSLMNEGTGDVDLRFREGSREWKHHVQVKDHEVAPAELREVIENFVECDSNFSGEYAKFILACPSLGATVRSLETSLIRLRGAQPFYDDRSILAPTEADVRSKIIDLGLCAHADFIINKVDFQAGVTDYHDDAHATNIFRGRISRHPKFAQLFQNVADAAYALLLQHVMAARGRVIASQTLEELVVRSFQEALKNTEPKIVVNLHNWTVEKYSLPADVDLDWSKFFDRGTRRVPTKEEWQTNLLPQLADTKMKLLRDRVDRLIAFQGKACLSSGIAFGATFCRAGGWVIEIRQPTAMTSWRSDAAADSAYKIVIDEQALSPSGDSIVLLFNITGKAKDAVLAAIKDLSISAKALITIAPGGSTPGSNSISGDGEAVSLAQGARDALHDALGRHQVGKTHLFFYGPQGLAIFLGQRLTAVKEIQLYEYKDPGYEPSCSIKT